MVRLDRSRLAAWSAAVVVAVLVGGMLTWLFWTLSRRVAEAFQPQQFFSNALEAPTWAVKPDLANPVTNRAVVRNLRLAKTVTRTPKLVLYGDSITAYHALRPQVWRKFWPSLEDGLPLGVGGATLADLAWRISNGERVENSPDFVVVMIGINDVLRGRDPSTNMGEFLQWLKKVYPSSQIALMALLPCSRADVSVVNSSYQAVASQNGVQFWSCGQDIDPRDPSQMNDGIHPTDPTYNGILTCMQNKVLSSPAKPYKPKVENRGGSLYGSASGAADMSYYSRPARGPPARGAKRSRFITPMG